jgi:oligopeptide/dipeptide ABC transporter ATP-binding protein
VAAVLGLLPKRGALVKGSAVFRGADLLTLSDRELRAIRGRDISIVFQDPTTSFNPMRTVGKQISEAITVHDNTVTRRQARTRTIALLESVGVPAPESRFDQYPHEYSGGMRQRAMIAMAMANRPQLIIADEPTTALDVTIQNQVLEVLELARRETNAALVLISHDLGLMAQTADRVLVMYAGLIVESAPVLELFEEPHHPYTAGLLASQPRIDSRMNGDLYAIPGQPPGAVLPEGCAFHPRCPLSRNRRECIEASPTLTETGRPRHAASCHFHQEAAGARGEGLRVGEGTHDA